MCVCVGGVAFLCSWDGLGVAFLCSSCFQASYVKTNLCGTIWKAQHQVSTGVTRGQEWLCLASDPQRVKGSLVQSVLESPMGAWVHGGWLGEWRRSS